MGFQITTLIENVSPKDCFFAEHGLSLLIETESFRILYDTGSSPAFLKNARAMGKDLNALDAVVLSHGHYDHTGGMSALLTQTAPPKAMFYGRSFFDERYAKKADGMLDIGPTVTRQFLSSRDIPTVVVEQQPLNLHKGVYLLSGFQTFYKEETPPDFVFRGTGGRTRHDRFEDEVAVVLETEKELCLLSGCSHNGILSMCKHTEKLFGRPVTVFIGGTHLVEANTARIIYTCTQLKRSGVRRLGACHCNGQQASDYFDENFDGFFRNHVGSVVTID